MAKKDKVFSLFDFCKSADKLQVFDEHTLDDEGNIIPFIEQAAIITHYLQLRRDEELDLPYRNQAEGILRLWYDFVRENRQDIVRENMVAEGDDALQGYLFSELFRAPFPAPDHPTFTFIDLFAGIGGFRMTIQELGGKSVFSQIKMAA